MHYLVRFNETVFSFLKIFCIPFSPEIMLKLSLIQIFDLTIIKPNQTKLKLHKSKKINKPASYQILIKPNPIQTKFQKIN